MYFAVEVTDVSVPEKLKLSVVVSGKVIVHVAEVIFEVSQPAAV